MSLDVAPGLIEQAERGQVDEAEFVATVSRSLPYAWSVMSGVAGEVAAGFTNPEGFADHATPPPSEAERGQLLQAPPAAGHAGLFRGDVGRVELVFREDAGTGHWGERRIDDVLGQRGVTADVPLG